MKKTFRILGIALVATGLLFAGCKKTEDEEEDEDVQETTLEVSTTPSNKVAVIEEFTGNRCPNCPRGHRRVNEAIAAHPGKVIGINVHAGNLASAYTTQFGAAIDDEFNFVGYPMASVNRHTFSGYSEGGGEAVSDGSIAAVTDIILAQPACANMAAKATINQATRELTVEVAVYYTSNGTGSTNKLNVAILQDSIWGSQSGASNNPDYYNSSTGEYCHMHMLRHLITGQWGEDISPVTAGSKITKTYTYTIPEQISNEDVVLKHLHVVAFVAESKREVITGCEAPITFK